MAEHVRVLGIIGIVRAVLGILFGAWLLWKSSVLTEADYGQVTRVAPETLQLDRVAFSAVGWASLGLAPLWALQGILALAKRRRARFLGMGIAILDLLSLPFFPFSTALGLYGVVVYRHPETVSSLRQGGVQPAFSP